MNVQIVPAGLAPSRSRDRIAVFWKPGCSSCVKTKEFLEEQGIEFESINVVQRDDAWEEVVKAGLRGVPVVRSDGKYVYAQSLDDVATFLGFSRNHLRLPNAELVDRWQSVLTYGRQLIEMFGEDRLRERAIPQRDRSVIELAVHVFQIPQAFIMSLEEGLLDVRTIANVRNENIIVRADMIDYADAMMAKYAKWRETGSHSLPERLDTYYGNQPIAQVLERGVWHSAQHARQLDVLAAGPDGKLIIPEALYAGLPMPKRLWE
jgi:glutaredoxin